MVLLLSRVVGKGMQGRRILAREVGVREGECVLYIEFIKSLYFYN